jgi:hypothetical protein
MIFCTSHIRKPKNMQKKESFQAGMTWQCGRISDHRMSQRLYGWNTFIMWCLRVSRNGHSPMWKIRIGVFKVLLACTLVTLFSSFRMRSGWVDFFIKSIFYWLFFINIFNRQIFFLAGYDSWGRVKPDRAFCWNTYAEWWPPKRGATVRI